MKRRPSPCRAPRGFSLVELMIAVALGLVIMGMVGYTLGNASKAVNTASAQVRLHSAGSAVLRYLIRDLESMHPSGKILWDASNHSLMFLVSLSTLNADGDAASSAQWGITGNELGHDLAWVNYRWDSTDKILYRYLQSEEKPNDDSTRSPSPVDGHDFETSGHLGSRAANKNSVEPGGVFAKEVSDFKLYYDNDVLGSTSKVFKSTTVWPYKLRIDFTLFDSAASLSRQYTCSVFLPGNE